MVELGGEPSAFRSAIALQFDSESAQLRLGVACPAAICLRTGWARMQDTPNPNGRALEGGLKPALGERTDPDREPWAKQANHVAQSLIAGCKQRPLFADRQFVGRQISPPLVHEAEGAVIHDEESCEEVLGGSEALLRPTPQARAAD